MGKFRILLNVIGGVFDVDVINLPSFNDLDNSIKNLNPGGFYQPKDCVPREKLAIIIPYRDRITNLLFLLKYLHPLLQKQSRYYRIILIEQVINIFLLHEIAFENLTKFLCYKIKKLVWQ